MFQMWPDSGRTNKMKNNNNTKEKSSREAADCKN